MGALLGRPVRRLPRHRPRPDREHVRTADIYLTAFTEETADGGCHRRPLPAGIEVSFDIDGSYMIFTSRDQDEDREPKPTPEEHRTFADRKGGDAREFWDDLLAATRTIQAERRAAEGLAAT